MASGTLPKPGTKYGPCKGTCAHRDCAQTRNTAASACSICGQPIGYDTHFYMTDAGPQHAVCAEDEEDARQARIRQAHAQIQNSDDVAGVLDALAAFERATKHD